MTKNMEQFLEKISQDKKLAEELNGMDTPEKVIDFAAKLGTKITKEDVDGAGTITEDGEVDLESADAVAGGKACVCIFGGGSTGNDDKDSGCCCVGAGTGTNSDSDNRCGCILVGVGNQCTYEGEMF